MIKTIGSQKREPLSESGYELIKMSRKEVILKDRDSGKQELWVKNDDYAGYVIEINGKGYEFVRSI
jgi:hypothetical protein